MPYVRRIESVRTDAQSPADAQKLSRVLPPCLEKWFFGTTCGTSLVRCVLTFLRQPMWGIVVGILGSAVAISVAQTWLEKSEDRPEASKSSGQGQLTEPGKDFKSSPDGKFTAPMWREVDAREALNKARRFGSKLK